METEISAVQGRIHRKAIRKRRWLYVKTNAWQHEGIRYGAKLRVHNIGTKWVRLIYRGRWYAFHFSQVATEEPSESGLNNTFTKILGGINR